MLRFLFLLCCVSLFGAEKYGHLKLEKEHPIDQSTLLYVKHALQKFEEEGVKLIVLDMDTPGGEVFSAMKISSLLREQKVPVIAYVNDWAISAGALLAYSCPQIVVNRGSIMGAAEPVLMGGSEPKPASEKTVSALRAEFASTAEVFHRNPYIAEAMVDKDILLVERKGKVMKADEVRRGDRVISGEGKLLTLRGEELITLGVADEIVDGYLPQVSEMEAVTYSHWKIYFYSFLTSPLVASLLMMAMMAGFYMEMSSPGFGWPGVIALSSLAVILLTNFTLYTADYLELIFLIIGAVLLMVEIFVIPGFGLVGILGLIFMVGGLFLLSIPFVNVGDLLTFKINFFEKEALMSRLSWLLLFFILSCATLALLAKLFSKKILKHSKLILNERLDHPQLSFQINAGEMGKAYTNMRPSGKVMIGQEVYDGLSQGTFIEKGAAITVIRQEGEKVIVKECST